MGTPDLTASFVTLSGAGFAQPARVPFAERCHAAAAAGFTGIGQHLDDYEQMRTQGVSDTWMRELLKTHQLTLNETEFLGGWAITDDARTEPLTNLSAAFHPHHVTAGEFSADTLDIPTAGARLRTICDQITDHGVRVAVEAFPWSSLKDVATARAVVEASGAQNAGLMIDVWHFYNSRSTLADLSGLDPERIVAVQLNDGRLVHDDFRAEARRGRLLPGDGNLDVAGLLQGLHEFGFRGPYCVEVNYPGYRDLPVADMARQAFAKASAALASLPG